MGDPGLRQWGQFPVFRHLAPGQDMLGLSCPISGKERYGKEVESRVGKGGLGQLHWDPRLLSLMDTTAVDRIKG